MLVDSFVLRNPPERQAANRCMQAGQCSGQGDEKQSVAEKLNCTVNNDKVKEEQITSQKNGQDL
ncbi:hypothetical protein FACS1894153_2620 [Bacteroidia bacterium]|nr:hypothetical protein FACS1894153_2620 [Bacteroidia bacterium]